MNKEITPFNVRLLQLSDAAIRGLRPITTSDTFDGATKNFNPNGLFSNEIFGPNGDKSRMRRFAYIDIKIPIMHPLIFRSLGKLKRIYPEIMAGRQYAAWDEETKDLVKSDAIDGGTGYTFFMEHFDKIVFPERLSDQRALTIKLIERTRSVAMNTRIIVAPAGYRDYVILDDREEEDEVNKLYRKLIAHANSVSHEIFVSSAPLLDRVRWSMQSTFNQIYEYYESIIRGKNKLILGHVMTRQVRDGTRNVLTTQNLDVKELFGAGTPTTNSTGIGLFQFIKAFRPKCLYHIQNGFLKEVFRSPGAPARLVNRRTLLAEEVILPMAEYDRWMTSEGIEKLFNLFSETERRHAPLPVDNYWLALIYNDGKHYKLLSSIEDLPAGWDKKYVSPCTFAEFVYSQVFHVEDEVTLNVTRFPVLGFGSIYPSEPYLKVTTETVKLWPLDDQWEIDSSRGIAREFPMRTEAFIDTMMPSPDKLAGLDGDFDGDKGTGNGVYTDEGVAESKAVMRSRAYHIRTDGSIAHSLSTDTVNYLFGSMTGAPEVRQGDIDKFTLIYGQLHNVPAPSTESIREDLTGVIIKTKKRTKKKEIAKEHIGDLTEFIYFGNGKVNQKALIKLAKERGEKMMIDATKVSYSRSNAKEDDPASPIIITDNTHLLMGFNKYRARTSRKIEALYLPAELVASITKVDPMPQYGKEGYHKPDTALFTASMKLDSDTVNRDVVDAYKQAPELLKALSEYISSPNQDLAQKLKALAELVQQHQPRKSVKVYRCFDTKGNQESFGIKNPRDGLQTFFDSEHKLVSTSLEPIVAASYGPTMVEIDLDEDDSYLVITDELSVACAELNNGSVNDSQKEVLILPPMRISVRVVDMERSEIMRKAADANVTAEISENFTYAFESYREGPNDTFESNGVLYDINKIFETVEASPVTRLISVDKLNWVLDFDRPDPARVMEADISYPIIVVPFKMGTYLTVDGLHRVASATQQGIPKLTAYVMTPAQLEACRIK